MHLRQRLLSTLFLGLSICLLCSCEKTFWRSHTPDSYHSYRSPDASAWHRRDTLCFHVPPLITTTANNTQQDYCLDVPLRLLDTYPYRDLQLHVTVEELLPLRRRFTLHRESNAKEETLRCDTLVTYVQPVRRLTLCTLRYNIFDEQDRPQAATLPHLLTQKTLSHIRLNPSHHHRILITHHMRLDPLPGISDVGVHLYPTDSKP